MELAEAYVTIRADISELKKGLGAARQETEKATGFLDKQASRLTSSFMRMGGGIALMHLSVSAMGGALEGIKAGKAFDWARQTNDVEGMVAAYGRARDASRRWFEAIPFLGGALGQLSRALQDDTVIEFGKRFADVSRNVNALAGDLNELTRAQIARAKAEGAPPAKVAMMEAAAAKKERTEHIGKLSAAEQDARQLMEKTEAKAAEARKYTTVRPYDIFQLKRLQKAEALEAEAQAARVTYQKANVALRQEMKAGTEWAAAEEATIEQARRGQLGMMPAGAGMPPPPGIPIEDVGIKLDRIGNTLDKIEAKTGTME